MKIEEFLGGDTPGLCDFLVRVQEADALLDKAQKELSQARNDVQQARSALGRALAEAGLIELGEFILVPKHHLSAEQITAICSRN